MQGFSDEVVAVTMIADPIDETINDLLEDEMFAEILEWIRRRPLLQAEQYLRIYDFVIAGYKNGIRQGGEKWKQSKRFTVGGSSMATIMGMGYGNISSLLTDRIGLTEFKARIEPQWGNLMEHVIEMFVEKVYDCKIMGENLYIEGPPGTAYSPDGLTVIDSKITLLEFKAPYSRLPDGKVPKYYIPQVKMGLQILPICDTGLFIECVIRRCRFRDLNFEYTFDTSLVAKYIGKEILAYGIIGFYVVGCEVMEIKKEFADYGLNDLGMCSPGLFTKLMSLYNDKRIKVVYSDVIRKCDIEDTDSVINATNTAQLSNLVNQIYELNGKMIGILPYKILHADFHYIERTPNYIDPYLDLIKDIVDTVMYCTDPANESRKFNEIQSFMERHS